MNPQLADPGLDSDLVALPKGHLHVHLRGSMRRTTRDELAARHGVEVPEPPKRYTTWQAFRDAYRASHQVLRASADLHRVITEVVEDAAADGVVWLEISLSPSGYRAVTGSDQATMELVSDAATSASAVTGIGVGLVLAADRGRDRDQADAIGALAAAWAGRGVVGFGLGGDETLPARPFARAAALARDAGLLVVPHAGELAGPASVRETLTWLQPDRIMHGVRALEDPALLAELVDRGIALDVCPSSNVALGVVESLESHPLPVLLRDGVRCTLAADDTLLFSTSIAAEYHHARHRLGLNTRELADLARASLQASAAPPARTEPALRAIDTWAQQHAERGADLEHPPGCTRTHHPGE